MQKKHKPNLIAVAFLTASIVGIINIGSALVAYSLLFPEAPSQGSLITSEAGATGILPQPPSPSKGADGQGAAPTAESHSHRETRQVYRQPTDRLVAGQQPKPAVVVTQPNGQQTYKWCSGTNPDLPDEVCQAIISIVASPTESNPHLGQKGKDALSLLPQNSSLTLIEDTWKQPSPNTGSMDVIAHTTEYGDVRLRVVLEKINTIWVVTDGWAL